MDIADLREAAWNPRQIDDASLAALQRSQAEFGDLSGIVWNRVLGCLVCGHQRLKALKAAHGEAALRLVECAGGMLIEAPDGTTWPVRVVDWDRPMSIAANIAANSSKLTGKFTEGLGLLFPEVKAALPELAVALRLPEIEFPGMGKLETRPEDDEVPEAPVEPVTKRGDVWLLGDHRLMCGDSTSSADVATLMNGEKAKLCFTSPPYAQQRDYTEAARVTDWDALMNGVFGNLTMADDGQVLVNLGLVHRNNEWQPYWEKWIEWMRGQGWRRFAWYVWDKTYGKVGDGAGRFASAFEFVFHFNKMSVNPVMWVETKEESRVPRHVGSTERQRDGTLKPLSSSVGRFSKIPDSVIRCSPATGAAGIDHPAQFSVAFAQHFIRSWPGLVYEPFSGAGTTIVAAEILGERCFAMDIEPHYVDVALGRYQKRFGKVPVLAGTGEAFPVALLEHTGQADSGRVASGMPDGNDALKRIGSCGQEGD